MYELNWTELQHSESTYRDRQQMPTLPISPVEHPIIQLG